MCHLGSWWILVLAFVAVSKDLFSGNLQIISCQNFTRFCSKKTFLGLISNSLCYIWGPIIEPFHQLNFIIGWRRWSITCESGQLRGRRGYSGSGSDCHMQNSDCLLSSDRMNQIKLFENSYNRMFGCKKPSLEFCSSCISAKLLWKCSIHYMLRRGS